jgi:outer membrane protein assembly factor BamA
MRIRPFASALGVIAALLGTGRATEAQRAEKNDQSERPEVRALTLSGVRSVDRDELVQSIATSASHCKSFLLYPFCPLTHSGKIWEKRYLDRTELRRDVLRIRVFYWIRVFRQATVDTTVAERGQSEVAVTFKIVEGAPTLVRNVHIRQLDSVLTTAQINSVLKLKAGEPFSLIALDSSVAHLRVALQDRGYADARVDTATAVDTATKQGCDDHRDSALARARGSDHHRGQQAGLERTIKTRSASRPGTCSAASSSPTASGAARVGPVPARPSRPCACAIRREPRATAAARLDSLRAVRDTARARGARCRAGCAARPRRIEADAIRAIEVEVAEAPQRLTRVSGGFNTFDFVQVDARFTHNNVFGGARRLGAVATLGNLFARQLNGSTLGG